MSRRAFEAWRRRSGTLVNRGKEARQHRSQERAETSRAANSAPAELDSCCIPQSVSGGSGARRCSVFLSTGPADSGPSQETGLLGGASFLSQPGFLSSFPSSERLTHVLVYYLVVRATCPPASGRVFRASNTLTFTGEPPHSSTLNRNLPTGSPQPRTFTSCLIVTCRAAEQHDCIGFNHNEAFIGSYLAWCFAKTARLLGGIFPDLPPHSSVKCLNFSPSPSNPSIPIPTQTNLLCRKLVFGKLIHS